MGDTWQEADFEKLRELGRGGMSIVWLGRHLPSRNLYALKETRWPLDRLDRVEKKRATEELDLLRGLEGQEYASSHGVSHLPGRACRAHGAYHSVDGRLVLVLELIVGVTLLRHLRVATDARFNLLRARFYLADCVDMLDTLHSRGIVYRDLKITNLILEQSSGQLRLVDFGFAKQLSRATSNQGTFKRTYSTVGSPHAMAPEVLAYTDEVNEDGYCEVGYTFSTDWWALGVLACELMSGKPPFGYRDGDISAELSIAALAAGSPATLDWTRFPGPLQDGDCELSLAARDLLCSLLQADPTLRLGSKGGSPELWAHPFFKGFDKTMEESPEFDTSLWVLSET